MAGWTAGSLFPQTFLRNVLNPPAPTQNLSGGPLTPEQKAEKLRLSGGIVRQALTQPAATRSTVVTPGATGPGTSAAANTGTVVVPRATSGANSATSVVPAATSNVPPFLQGGQNQQLPIQGADALAQLIEALGLGRQQQDPDLVKAQTVLAQQQAMQVARGNEAARNREANLAAQTELRSNLKDASKYSGMTGDILRQRYTDQLKVLQNEGSLNWLNMPSSAYSVPRKSGWTGPAMPGGWAI